MWRRRWSFSTTSRTTWGSISSRPELTWRWDHRKPLFLCYNLIYLFSRSGRRTSCPVSRLSRPGSGRAGPWWCTSPTAPCRSTSSRTTPRSSSAPSSALSHTLTRQERTEPSGLILSYLLIYIFIQLSIQVWPPEEERMQRGARKQDHLRLRQGGDHAEQQERDRGQGHVHQVQQIGERGNSVSG